MSSRGGEAKDVLEYEQGNLQTGTNWWGAFVIGLAGTILVTGAAPAFLTVFGASPVAGDPALS